jgi:DNA-binding transcriptional LysR family regulator
MRRADLADLTAFIAVADTLGFRAAASRLGVTPSALSHTMWHFEEQLGFRLLNRKLQQLAHRCGPASARPAAAGRTSRASKGISSGASASM